MSLLKKKKGIFLVVTIALTSVVILGALAFLFTINHQEEDIVPKISTEALLYKEFIARESVNRELVILNNKNESKKNKYESLKRVKFLFEVAYTQTFNPKIRNFSQVLDKYASTNYKEFYNKHDFGIACADEECGEKTPEEISQIIEVINSLKIEEDIKYSIRNNLIAASHIPYNNNEEQKLDKQIGYWSSYQSLVQLNNIEASKAASSLKIFVKEKYNQDL